MTGRPSPEQVDAAQDIPPMPHTDFIITKAGAFTVEAVEAMHAEVVALRAKNEADTLQRRADEIHAADRAQDYNHGRHPDD